MADSRLRPPLRRSPFLSARAARSPYARSYIRYIRFGLPNSLGDPTAPQISPSNATVNAANLDPSAHETLDGMSESDRILLHKLKKDAKEQSTQIVKLTDMLAATVRESIPPPPCTQWEFVKTTHGALVRIWRILIDQMQYMERYQKL